MPINPDIEGLVVRVVDQLGLKARLSDGILREHAPNRAGAVPEPRRLDRADGPHLAGLAEQAAEQAALQREVVGAVQRIIEADVAEVDACHML
ncbi:hypothetical protein H8A97_42475 [Bradyrhizobium sp. Arg62]|nr:hypothetical protein [Bradyrhizobium brasilense]